MKPVEATVRPASWSLLFTALLSLAQWGFSPVSCGHRPSSRNSSSNHQSIPLRARWDRPGPRADAVAPPLYLNGGDEASHYRRPGFGGPVRSYSLTLRPSDKVGEVYWLPTFLAAMIPAGLLEELTYLGLILGGLRERWRLPQEGPS